MNGKTYFQQLNAFFERCSRESWPSSMRIVYCALLHLNNKARWENPFGASLRMVADYSGANRDTVSSCLHKLAEMGVINYRPTKTRGQLSEIEIIPLCTENGTQNSFVSQKADTNKGFVSQKADTNKILYPKKEVDFGTQNENPPIKENKTTHIRADFLTFWKAYPSKKDRLGAEKAFLKLKPDAALLAKMLSAIRIQSASKQWKKDGGEYIPKPSAWLNGRRWEDEAVAAYEEKHYTEF